MECFELVSPVTQSWQEPMENEVRELEVSACLEQDVSQLNHPFEEQLMEEVESQGYPPSPVSPLCNLLLWMRRQCIHIFLDLGSCRRTKIY